MKYYHGTSVKFTNLDLNFANSYKDFGTGIYLATQKGHAKSIANLRTGFYKCILIYEFDYNDMCSRFNIRRFRTASVDWVKYIIANRTTLFSDNVDVVIGPTADSKVQKIIQEFIHMYPSPTENDYRNLALLLKPYTFPDQVCLKSEQAVSYFNSKLVSIERL